MFACPVLVCGQEPPAEGRAFLRKNCAACHRAEKPPAGLNLTALPFGLDDPEIRMQWIRVHDAVGEGAMPPGRGSLPEAQRQRFLASLADAIASYEHRHAQESGRAVLRRLNRYEYENTVRDLLHAPWLQLRDSLPEGGIVQRFNKSGQALDVSHVQMARYMETAEHALRLVLEAAQELDAIDVGHMRLLTELIENLKGSSESGESLLDRTMVLYGSNLGDANKHTTTNLPVLLAGGGFRHVGHLAFDTRKNYPLPNLFVSMLQRMGIEADRFASSRGTMRGLEPRE